MYNSMMLMPGWAVLTIVLAIMVVIIAAIIATLGIRLRGVAFSLKVASCLLYAGINRVPVFFSKFRFILYKLCFWIRFISDLLNIRIWLSVVFA